VEQKYYILQQYISGVELNLLKVFFKNNGELFNEINYDQLKVNINDLIKKITAQLQYTTHILVLLLQKKMINITIIITNTIIIMIVINTIKTMKS
jgi:hypothetical protein